MERRVLVAISLSFFVLFAYQALFVPPQPPEGFAANVTAPVETVRSLGQAIGPGNITASAPTAVPLSAPVVGESVERDIVVETAKVRAVFTNRGGRLRHWVLKEFRNDQGEPIDLIPASVPPTLPRPFALRVEDPAVTSRLNDTLYRTTQDANTVTFDVETTEGLRARKVFALDPNTFVVTVTVHVQQGDAVLNPFIEWGPGMTDGIAMEQAGSFLSPSYTYKAQAIYHTGSDVEREAATALGSGVVREGQYRWAGVDDHYFISAVLQPPTPVRLEYQPIQIPTLSTPPVVGTYVGYAVRFPTAPDGVRFYVGPKRLDIMRSIDPEFTRAIYFGMFAWLAAPLLDALRWVHGHVGSWGWSIIVLTILINLAMFPLRHKSVVSMRRMQEIQPQMKAIQARYAKYKITDPERQKMNTEVMELYRSKGVNPASGCVPMLLTMPFLFAFYAMLGQAIEIRGENFWWITDLSKLDPLFITPALMGISMFWQQKIMPTTADPTQQKIMMFMPVMITVTMIFAPAGLVIYWLMSNVWSIGQQYFTNWMIGAPPAAAGLKGAKDAKALKDSPKDIVVPPARSKK
ncbi:MAG: membrane protein insertase YidC [Acidobacteria bacterium]|nr:membrane protein insertase YidC [Acidobacteriota bacterium]